jgi:hypothetical protein
MCEISGLLSASAQPTCLEFFPFLLLLTSELAWQRFHGNVVLVAELPPEDKAHIECAGFVGDYIVYRWFVLLRHNPEARRLFLG